MNWSSRDFSHTCRNSSHAWSTSSRCSEICWTSGVRPRRSKSAIRWLIPCIRHSISWSCRSCWISSSTCSVGRLSTSDSFAHIATAVSWLRRVWNSSIVSARPTTSDGLPCGSPSRCQRSRCSTTLASFVCSTLRWVIPSVDACLTSARRRRRASQPCGWPPPRCSLTGAVAWYQSSSRLPKTSPPNSRTLVFTSSSSRRTSSHPARFCGARSPVWCSTRTMLCLPRCSVFEASSSSSMRTFWISSVSQISACHHGVSRRTTRGPSRSTNCRRSPSSRSTVARSRERSTEPRKFSGVAGARSSSSSCCTSYAVLPHGSRGWCSASEYRRS